MRFKDLGQKEIDYAKAIHQDGSLKWDDKMRILIDFFGKSERTVRKWLVRLGIKNRQDVEIESEQYQAAKLAELDKTKKYYLITAAQNNTPVVTKFLKNMEKYADFLNGSIIVIPYRYRNPTSLNFDSSDEHWHPSIVKYLNATKMNLNSKFTVLGDIKVQPTSVNPLLGAQGFTDEKSCILGHPSIHFETMPVLEGYDKKFMMTTGVITKENYTDTLTGKRGEFNHTFGFAIVEVVDDEKFFVRQVTANSNGSFTDLFFKVSDEKISVVDECGAVVFGDIHVGDHNEKVVESAIKMCRRIKPGHIILHDLFNAKSINHHELDNPFHQFKLEKDNKNSLKQEIDDMLDWLEQLNDFNVVVVKSNHDDFVSKWLLQDWRKQKTIKNSVEYMKFAALLLEGKAPNGIIPYVINERFPKIKCLGINDGFIVNSWELGQHSNIGTSGTRGSLSSYSKLSIKCILGHGHCATRKKGAIMVGTFTNLRVGYNHGPSKWVNACSIVNKDKKAQIIIFNEDGEYTTLKKLIKKLN